jgi:hypothetical protein
LYILKRNERMRLQSVLRFVRKAGLVFKARNTEGREVVLAQVEMEE